MSVSVVEVGARELGCRRWGGGGWRLLQVRQLFPITLILIFVVSKVKNIIIIITAIIISCCSSTYRTKVSWLRGELRA